MPFCAIRLPNTRPATRRCHKNGEGMMGPQEVVRSTGVSASTLRHYERLGLLLNVRRNQSGYRRYPQTVVNRVLLIQRALAIGFSLADVRRVLSVRDKGGAPCQGVR